ncbi:F-box/WD repeat-containing protein 1A [Madurella fahalii]|uniref:F-box/WD repeat-containing protein 1A n=1 Tax=Madurella fahalii TaxID=1157608 RepID=A0ABQ0GJZ8_9PEZI
MAGFTPQPDEGYSEDPLTALSASTSFSLKPREDTVTALGSARSADEFPAWLVQHISNLSISRKTELAMALLNDLPTTVISQIVEQLNPRLYIDFVRYLPPEVCLKILGYLDPLSLINVARSCRAWYDLALDRKLWEQLYYLEGWKAIREEIEAAERDVNRTSSSSHGVLRRGLSQDDGHAHKKRAIAVSPTVDADMDMVMLDASSSVKQEPAEMEGTENSIFGGPRRPSMRTGISQRMGDLDMQSPASGSGYRVLDKGKGRALSPSPPNTVRSRDEFLRTVLAPPPLAKSTLWVWDGPSRKFKINWKYLYTMRRRLESNWERGNYTNFQLPHPDHPEEGHGECIYSLQYNSKYLVSGSRDRTLKVWDLKTRRCLRTLTKHRGSVLCLQFDSDPDEDLIVSGSSDSDVIIWKFSTGKEIQTLRHAHRESVLNVKFDKRILVTCSKDKTIKVFNRRPLRHGDLGYPEVDPVPRNIKDYGYNIPMSPDDFPETPPWTMIGTLEGHGAAVNAVQIHDREVVSASGDRNIKVWDWPTQACTRTIVGHTKGIACVQYDGRRIVSGSSDNEVKVFDRQTGLEVANLRSHSSLVRTVQAGFGDLPYSVEDDLAEAKKVDEEYFKAVESGLIDETERPRARRRNNAGSRRPEDINAYGAKLPPGGGGGKYGRIVSGSYDTTIIIWRRDKEGIWKDQHHLKQDEAAVAAMRQGRAQTLIPLHPSVQGLVSREPAAAPSAAVGVGAAGTDRLAATPSATGSSRLQTVSAPSGSATGPTLPPLSALTMQLSQEEPPSSSVLPPAMFPAMVQVIDNAVQGGLQAFSRAIAAHPAILTHRGLVESAIERLQNPVTRSQLRQTYSAALIRAQFEQARQRREALRNQETYPTSSPAAAGQGPSHRTAEPALATGTSNPRASAQAQSAGQLTPAQLAAAAAHQAHAQVPHGAILHQVLSPAPGSVPSAPLPALAQEHHPHIAQAPLEIHDAANPARVFKLQYDAHRIICCSQRSVIVGWDFCNGDPELEEASRFFQHVE